MKILLIAPGCNGEDVGEAWVAYQWASRLSSRHDVTVLSHYKRGFAPAAGQVPDARVVEWSEPPLWHRAERLNSMLKPSYPLFYARSRRWIRQALGRGESFDVAHQVVPVAMRYGSPAAGLGIPLVIGPVGGGLESPPAFKGDDGSAPWFVGLRRLDQMRLRLDPWLRRTYRTASCVLGIAPYTELSLRAAGSRRIQFLSETALEKLPDPVDRSLRRGPVRLLFVGRLIRTKGVRDLVSAFASIDDLDVELDIVGDGPERAICEDIVRDDVLAGRVRFHGRLPRDQVDDYYRRADVFVFPSYREPGGNVVPEAMGHGLPVITTDRGGPGMAASDASAFRLPVSTPAELARDVALAIRTLVADPALRLRMGAAGRQEVEEKGMWTARIEAAEDIYRAVLTEGIAGETAEQRG